MALALAVAGTGAGGQEIGHELLGVHAEKHAVDGLELQGVVIQVHQLHQGVAGGMGQLLLRGEGGLELLPAGLGRGQGVVAVAHGIDQDGLALGVEHRLNRRGDGRFVCHVRLHMVNGRAAAAFFMPGKLVHRAAVRGKVFRCRRADAGAAAGHDGDLSHGCGLLLC